MKMEVDIVKIKVACFRESFYIASLTYEFAHRRLHALFKIDLKRYKN